MQFLFSLFVLLSGQPSYAIHGGELVDRDDPMSKHTVSMWHFHGSVVKNCSGTVIDRSWVLTAGHCMYDKDGNRTDTITVESNSEDVSLDSNEIFVHPNYYPGNHEDDLALIYFKKGIPSRLSPARLVDKAPKSGDNIYAAGYGRGSKGGKLHKLKLTITQPRISKQINWSQTCQRGIDYGDSGGSIYSKGILAGVIAHFEEGGEGCNGTVYAISTTPYLGWIKKIMGHSPQSSHNDGEDDITPRSGKNKRKHDEVRQSTRKRKNQRKHDYEDRNDD